MSHIKDIREVLIRVGPDALSSALDNPANLEHVKLPGVAAPTRPRIQLPQAGYRLVSEFAAELGAHLAPAGIFRFGEVAVVVNENQNGLKPIDALTLRSWAENHVVPHKTQNGQVVHATMTADTAKTVLHSPQFLGALPAISGVNPCPLPVFRSDGHLELSPEGHDMETGIFTAATVMYGAMTQAAARAVIEDLLKEFPFANDGGRSKAIAVAAMLTLFCRGMLPEGSQVPAFFYLANAEGAGKTTLAQVAIGSVFGHTEIRTMARSEDELRKELLAAVIHGRRYMLFDNLKGHLSSAVLEAFLSSTTWTGRILGQSTEFSGNGHVTVFLTGNGCTFSPDIRRRSLCCELFMCEDRAEDRHFDRTLDAKTIADLRQGTLSALWTLVKTWHDAGRPGPGRTHPSFPRWAEVVAGIVEFHGWASPVESPAVQVGDREGTSMRQLVAVMPKNQPLTFASLVRLCVENGLFDYLVLPDGQLNATQKSKLGKLLAKYNCRQFGNYGRFVVEGQGHGRRFELQSRT